MTIFKCDRCGKEINLIPGNVEVIKTNDTSYDLCNECFNKFELFVRGKEGLLKLYQQKKSENNSTKKLSKETTKWLKGLSSGKYNGMIITENCEVRLAKCILKELNIND